jgi:hypothetical protein
MALPARASHFPAYAPLDEATRPELLEPGRAVLLAENVRPTENGGYETRRGYASMTLDRYGATTRSAGRKLFPSGSTIGVIDGTYLDVYDEQADAWKTMGRVPEADFALTPLPAGGMALAATEIAYANGYFAIAYRGQTGNATTTNSYAYAAVVNASTGAVVRLPEQIYTAVASPGFVLVNVASYSDRYLVVLVSPGSGGGGSSSILGYYLDTNTAASIEAGWVSIGTIASDWNESIDPAVQSLSDRVAVAYALTSGTDRVKVKTFNLSGVLETATINSSSTTPTAVAVAGSVADTLWVAWNESTTIKIKGLDADSLASTLASTASILTTSASPLSGGLRVAANSAVAGKGRIYATSDANSYMRGFQTSGAAAATDGSQITFLSTRMMGRPMEYGGRYYAMFRTSLSRTSFADSNTQENAVLSDWSEDVSYVRPVANVAPGLVPAFLGASLVGAGLHAQIGAKLYSVLNIKKSASALSPSLVAFDFATPARWQSVTHNGTTFLSGGLLSVFDGKRVAEVGFLSRPAKPTTAKSGTGFTAATGVRYVAVYEEIDGAGNWCVSGISDPSDSTGAVANQTVTVSTTPLTLSGRLSTTDQVTGVRTVWYRTLDGGNPPYYRLGTSFNSTSATVTYADTMSDTDLATQTKLYAANLPSSVGEKLDRRAPPGLRYPVSCNGVLVGARGSVLYHSGQPVDGEETWFSPIFQSPVDGEGDITALGVQDGTIYVFKRKSVYAVQVEAPADNGSSGGLGAPRRLAVDVGCIDARSVVVTSLGIFFQSDRGIELLTRAQAVEPVGASVVDTMGSYPVCVAATIDAVRDVVYFELAASETDGVVGGNGRTLVFDLTLRSWVGVDRKPSYSGTTDTPAQSAAIVWNGSTYRYAWLETGGRVRVEQDAYYDSGSADAFIVPRVEYPPFKFGLQQRAKFWEAVALVERYSAAGLKIEHIYDWSTAYSSSDDKVWTEAETSGKRQLHWRMKGGERQAVRMRVSATAPVTLGTGRGFAFVGFSINGAPKQGATKGTPNLDPAGRQ